MESSLVGRKTPLGADDSGQLSVGPLLVGGKSPLAADDSGPLSVASLLVSFPERKKKACHY